VITLPFSAVFCAFGSAHMDIEQVYEQSRRLQLLAPGGKEWLADFSVFNATVEKLEERAKADLSAEGLPAGDAVRLVPKAQASAAYGVAETGNFTPSQCVAANFKSLEVTLGGVGSWWVALAGSTCTLLASTSVTGVVPGSSGLTP